MSSKTVSEYIQETENEASQEMLINTETGELWAVDHYALRERGYPDDNWTTFSSVSKAVLVELIYKLQGWDTINK